MSGGGTLGRGVSTTSTLDRPGRSPMRGPGLTFGNPSGSVPSAGVGLLAGLAVSAAIRAQAGPPAAADVLAAGTVQARRIELVDGEGKPLSILASGYVGAP